MTKISIQKKTYRKPLCATMAVQTAPLLQISGVRVGDRKQVEDGTILFEDKYDIHMADESHKAWGEVEVD